jgi:phosphatidylserine decarboxylase
MRTTLYRGFARRYGADLSEAERPLDEYQSFDAFFTRRLRSGVRAIDLDPRVAVSPVDGTLVEAGLSSGGRLIQAKGIDYTLRGLLIDEEEASRFSGGAYATLYLAPRDYHRIHTPVDARILGYRHVPGACFPVNGPAVRHISGLFARNERLITYLDSELGRVAVVKVAATGVSDITAAYDATLSTRTQRRPCRIDYDPPRHVRKGEELGVFHLGSTVIVLFEPGQVELERIEPGQRVRLGEALARRAASSAGDAAA